MKYKKFEIGIGGCDLHYKEIGGKEDYFLCDLHYKEKEEQYDKNIYTIDKEVIIDNIKYYITKIEFSVYTAGEETGNYKIFKVATDNLYYEEETDPVIRLELANYI